jgi:hypothetical protein
LSDLEDHNTAEDLKLRIFNTLSGNSIIGIVLKETPDSFLVALPSKLMAVKDKRAIEPYMPIRFCRMHKATILTTIPCFGEFEIFYIQYLLSEGRGQYPDVIGGAYESRLKQRYDQLKAEASKLQEELENIASEPDENELGTSIMSVPTGKYKH